MNFSKQISGNLIPNLIMQDFELRKSLKKWRNKELCWGVLTNLGVGYGIKRVYEILSYDFFINFKFSKINKISFLVKCNSAVRL